MLGSARTCQAKLLLSSPLSFAVVLISDILLLSSYPSLVMTLFHLVPSLQVPHRLLLVSALLQLVWSDKH